MMMTFDINILHAISHIIFLVVDRNVISFSRVQLKCTVKPENKRNTENLIGLREGYLSPD